MHFNFDRFEFREIRAEEGEEAAMIESICFPPNEACTREQMIRRAEQAPEVFLVAIDRINPKIAGFLCGISTDDEKFRDEFFTDSSLHKKNGKNIFLLGLDVLPEYRHRGLATAIMDRYIEREEQRGRKQLILTCHDHLIEFYEGFGFEDLGIGDSSWGDSQWHDMCIRISEE